MKEEPDHAPFDQKANPALVAALPGPYGPSLLEKSLRLWRTDLDMRVAEVIFTPDPADSELVGLSDRDFLPRAQAREVRAAKEKALLSRAPVHTGIAVPWRGRPAEFDCLYLPVLDTSGAPCGVSGLAIEISRHQNMFYLLATLMIGYGTPGRGVDWRRLAGSLPDALDAPRFTNRFIGDLEVDVAAHAIKGPDGTVQLAATEWQLLQELLRNRRCIVPRRALLEAVWGSGYEDDFSLLHDAISRLRRRFKEAGVGSAQIETRQRVGYRLIDRSE